MHQAGNEDSTRETVMRIRKNAAGAAAIIDLLMVQADNEEGFSSSMYTVWTALNLAHALTEDAARMSEEIDKGLMRSKRPHLKSV